MLEAIQKRRSIRKYQKKEIEQGKLDEILKAAMYSPTAMNKRSWEFIVVKDQKMKNRLSKATPWCDFAKDAPVVLIIAAYDDSLSWWIEDCSIAAEAIYLEAQNQGLGTCFCQVIGTKSTSKEDSEKFIRQLIHAPENLRILCMMPLGYPAEKMPAHSEKQFDRKKIHYEKY
jgi:nitroreductase